MVRRGITLAVLAAVVVGCGTNYGNTHENPPLTDEQMQWHTDEICQEIGVGSTSFTVSLSGYKLIRAYETGARKTQTGTIIPAKYMVEWGWKIVIKNNGCKTASPADTPIRGFRDCDKRCLMFVKYFLVDKDGFTVTESIEMKMIAPGQTITIQTKGIDFEYNDLKRIAKGIWEVSIGKS